MNKSFIYIYILQFHRKIQDFENCFDIGELINAANIINDMVKFSIYYNIIIWE